MHHFGDVPFHLWVCAFELIQCAVPDVVPFVATSGQLATKTNAIHSGTKGEYVAPGPINRVEAKHLPGHVTIVALIGVACVNGIGQSEVAELEFVVLDEDVVRLDVEVDEIVGVDHVEGKAHLAQEFEESVPVVLHEASLFDLLHQGVIAEFHLNEEPLGIVTATAFHPTVVVSDDMEGPTTRAVRKGGESINFLHLEGQVALVANFNFLDGVQDALQAVDSSAHLPEGAPSNDVYLLEVVVVTVDVKGRSGGNGVVETIAPFTAAASAAAGLVDVSYLDHGGGKNTPGGTTRWGRRSRARRKPGHARSRLGGRERWSTRAVTR